MARNIRISKSNTELFGTNGDDILNGIGDSFTLTGGNGNDTYIVDDAGDTVNEKNNGGIDQVISYVDFVLGNHVENLTLEGTDNLSGTGNVSDNIIIGNSGDNTLYGLGGDDTLDGGAGDDLIDGGDGTDTAVFAGLSSDYVIVREGADLRVTSNLTGETDILRNIEFLSFSDMMIAETEIAEAGGGDQPAPLAVADTAAGDEDNAIVFVLSEPATIVDDETTVVDFRAVTTQ